MFFHMQLSAKEPFTHTDREYEIAVYRAEEDGHLRGYISEGGFGDLMAEVSGETASDLRTEQGVDPVQELIELLRAEIRNGNFRGKSDT